MTLSRWWFHIFFIFIFFKGVGEKPPTTVMVPNGMPLMAQKLARSFRSGSKESLPPFFSPRVKRPCEKVLKKKHGDVIISKKNGLQKSGFYTFFPGGFFRVFLCWFSVWMSTETSIFMICCGIGSCVFSQKVTGISSRQVPSVKLTACTWK